MLRSSKNSKESVNSFQNKSVANDTFIPNVALLTKPPVNKKKEFKLNSDSWENIPFVDAEDGQDSQVSVRYNFFT